MDIFKVVVSDHESNHPFKKTWKKKSRAKKALSKKMGYTTMICVKQLFFCFVKLNDKENYKEPLNV